MSKAGIDYEQGVKRFLGRSALYDKTLGRFLKDGAFSRIRADFESGDKAALLADAHEFKGMCGNIAMPSLYESSSALVALLRREDCGEDELASAYERLDADYEAARAAITAAMEEERT